MTDNSTATPDKCLCAVRHQRCEPPYMRIYFEEPRTGYTELVGEIAVDVYDAIYPALKKFASNHRMILTESLIESDDDA